jgi:hypothetical protein
VTPQADAYLPGAVFSDIREQGSADAMCRISGDLRTPAAKLRIFLRFFRLTRAPGMAINNAVIEW